MTAGSASVPGPSCQASGWSKRHTCRQHVPKSEGVIHLAGDGRGAGWPGHSKDGNPRERAPRKGQQREGGREAGQEGWDEGAAASERARGGEARPSRMNGRREGGAGSVRRGGGLLVHQVTDRAPHLHSTLPSAHLPSSGPGEPPWAALAPRQSPGRGHAPGCVPAAGPPFPEQKPGSHHRGRCSLPCCSRPPDRVLGMRCQAREAGRQSPISIAGSANHTQEPASSSLSASSLASTPSVPLCSGEGVGHGGAQERERGGPGRMPTFPGGALGSAPGTLGPRDAAVGC